MKRILLSFCLFLGSVSTVCAAETSLWEQDNAAGIAAMRAGDYKSAEELLTKSADESEGENRKTVLNNLAVLYRKMNREGEAVELERSNVSSESAKEMPVTDSQMTKFRSGSSAKEPKTVDLNALIRQAELRNDLKCAEALLAKKSHELIAQKRNGTMDYAKTIYHRAKLLRKLNRKSEAIGLESIAEEIAAAQQRTAELTANTSFEGFKEIPSSLRPSNLSASTSTPVTSDGMAGGEQTLVSPDGGTTTITEGPRTTTVTTGPTTTTTYTYSPSLDPSINPATGVADGGTYVEKNGRYFHDLDPSMVKEKTKVIGGSSIFSSAPSSLKGSSFPSLSDGVGYIGTKKSSNQKSGGVSPLSSSKSSSMKIEYEKR